ncbi:MAG: hypothetical protein JNJ77_21225 [Planctomycetia bacterium]|nr:hypothetical protein [Planctomycetia bacterium]
MRVGYDSTTERELFILEIPDAMKLPEICLSTPRFVCLLLWNAEKTSDKMLIDVANWLLNYGAAYLCCWGNDCERVHDTIDMVDISRNPSCDQVVMTTWHRNELLDDAIYFALDIAWPDKGYSDGCGSVLAVCIDNAEIAEKVRAAFVDPHSFRGRMCP